MIKTGNGQMFLNAPWPKINSESTIYIVQGVSGSNHTIPASKHTPACQHVKTPPQTAKNTLAGI